MSDANMIDLDAGIPRYWALLLLSILLRLAGVFTLVLTVIFVFSVASFTSFASPTEVQPIPFPTLPPFPDFPRFDVPQFNFQAPPQLPNINAEKLARDITVAVGGFAAFFVLFWGLLTALGLYASGQFLVLLINHEENMRLTASALHARLVRRAG